MVDEKPKKCPACEIERLSYSSLEAMVLGVEIGKVRRDVSNVICGKHRARFRHASIQATAKMTEAYDA